jgi:outer membrane lipoprotein-sorting protein
MIEVTKRVSRILGLSVVVAVLAACVGQTTKPPKTEAELKDAPGTLLIMSEREQGVSELFTTRLYVNEGYLHMSDSRSPDDYVLFNRKEQAIYNVNQEDKTILVIRNKPVELESPLVLDYQEEAQPSNAIPKINGRQATHYKLTANGKHCYDSVVMPKDFMPDVLNAMREFRLVLAGEHATTINEIPKELLDACDLSLNIFHATKHMEHGLPIREWDRNGYQRFLKDYRTDVQATVGTFDLPKDFERYSIGDVLVQTPAVEIKPAKN